MILLRKVYSTTMAGVLLLLTVGGAAAAAAAAAGAVEIENNSDGESHDGDIDTAASTSTEAINKSGGGGLRWKDLGVSLEPCPLTTALMLDKFTKNNNHNNKPIDATVTANNNNNNHHQHCLDDSFWLLHPTSGYIENGSLCGIIGPSGAGKTSFLNALGGTTPRTSGVYLTGSVWYEEDCSMSMSLPDNVNGNFNANNNGTVGDCTGYHLSQQEGDIALLSQHDNFFDMLTPRECLEFASYLELQKHQKQGNTITSNEDENEDEHGSSKISTNYKEIAERKLASLGLLGVADRRIGDRTRMDGGGGGGGGGKRLFGWGRNMHKKQGSNKQLKVKRKRSGGGLSGGERRRLSVALELITEPKIFLADEPTTGLDSSQAEKVVKLISTLAKERNVPSVCTLHQPKSSIWRTLDQCILLAPGGKMCYAGDRQNATAHFKGLGFECPRDTNPAEYFIDLVSIDTDDPVQAIADKARIDLLHHKFLESCIADSSHTWLSNGHDGLKKPYQTGKSSIVMSTTKTKSLSTYLRTKPRNMLNAINRFGALLLRSLRQNVRNGRIIMLRLSASVVQAGLFASIFTSVRDGKSLTRSIADRVALLTFGVINMSIMALMKTLDLFAKERAVVMREQMRSNYSSLEYLLAKVLAEIPLDSFFALTFATILKKLTGLRTSMATLIKTYCLMTVTSVSLGFAIGSVTSSVESAMSLGVPIMVIFMVVGVINPSGIDPDTPPNRIMRLLKAGSPIKWAIEALVTAEFRGMEFGKNDKGRWGQLKDLPKMGALAMVKDGDNVLKNLGLGNAEYSDLMEKLGLLSSIYLFMSWVGLSWFGPSFMDTDDNML